MLGQVLLLDDNLLDLKIVTSVLERSGFACFGFTDHIKAQDWLTSNQVQMIFLDLQMPEMSGYQLIQIFRKNPKTEKVPIVIISGKNQVDDVKKAISLGANDYIIKPVDVLVLQEKIQRMTANNRQEEFVGVDVSEEKFEKIHFQRSFSIQTLSEFGLRIRSSSALDPGETVEIFGLPEEIFGSSQLMVRCLSREKVGDTSEFQMQLTFVGLSEAQRMEIRKSCRQFWIKIKKRIA